MKRNQRNDANLFLLYPFNIFVSINTRFLKSESYIKSCKVYNQPKGSIDSITYKDKDKTCQENNLTMD